MIQNFRKILARTTGLVIICALLLAVSMILWGQRIFLPLTAVLFCFCVLFSFSDLVLHLFSKLNEQERIILSLEHAKQENNFLQTTSIIALQKILLSSTEKEIIEILLESGSKIINSSGASFVPYDEWGNSLPSLIHAQIPHNPIQNWTQRLTSPETRQRCKNCEAFHGASGCVLLMGTNSTLQKVRCFPLQAFGREVGVINYYYDNDFSPNPEANKILKDIFGSAGQALENVNSRDKEIAALIFLQTVRAPKSDISALFDNLLESVQRALDADFVYLYIPTGLPGQHPSDSQLLTCSKDGKKDSDNFNHDLPFFEGIWKNVLKSGESISLENVGSNKNKYWKSLLAVPLAPPSDEPIGVLILGMNSAQTIAKRHQNLIETLARQAALILQNARLMVQVEYQAVVDERTRLAREIHDGLAQTLAFLKIQSTQMQNLLARGELDKLTSTLQANYRTLSDAYIDARQAIDDLRKVPTTKLKDWINHIASDFEQTANQKVSVSIADFDAEYPVNIQAQLIRIVQEALSNIRKHAQATDVTIVGFKDKDSYILQIRDNGTGFSPENISLDGSFRYGLRGMQERSESIGADFQITSQSGKGTVVSLRVPAMAREES